MNRREEMYTTRNLVFDNTLRRGFAEKLFLPPTASEFEGVSKKDSDVEIANKARDATSTTT
jgi:hypothetical protein